MNAITIIGGGLSGLALGAALQRAGVPTTIREAGTYPRHRVCGEFIAGLASKDTDSLDLQPSLADARHLSTVAWFYNGSRICGHRLPKYALGLSRLKLDARLAGRFESAGGNLQTGCRVPLEGDRPGMVWTTGHRPKRAPFLGLKAHVRGLHLTADLEMHLTNWGYIGLCKIDDAVVNICGLFKRRSIQNRSHSILLDYIRACGSEDLGSSLVSCEILEESSCAVAGLDYGIPSPEGPVLALGDARQLIPPFTGGGMAAAFAAAAEAVDPILRYARIEADWATTVCDVRLRLQRRLRLRLRLSRLIHPFLIEPKRQPLVVTMARLKLLPFRLFFRFLH
jgi:flavin-dependent dehydrogenase